MTTHQSTQYLAAADKIVALIIIITLATSTESVV